MRELSDESDDLAARRRAWFSNFKTWKRISWTSTFVIVVGSSYVASALSEHHFRQVAALIVAVCTDMQATIKPERRAQACRKAWIELDLTYKRLSKVDPLLLNALRQGENEIGETHAEDAKPGNAENSN